MAKNTLEKIIEKKINKINILKKNITIDSLKKKITENNSFGSITISEILLSFN